MALEITNFSITDGLAGSSGKWFVNIHDSSGNRNTTNYSVATSLTWNTAINTIKYEVFYGTTLGERIALSSATTSSFSSSDRTTTKTFTISMNTIDFTQFYYLSKFVIIVLRATAISDTETAIKEIIIPTASGMATNINPLDVYLYKASISNNTVVKNENGSNIGMDVYMTYNPTKISTDVSTYSLYSTTNYPSKIVPLTQNYANVLSSGNWIINNVSFTKVVSGIVKITGSLATSGGILLTLSADNHISGYSTAEWLRIYLNISDGTNNLPANSTAIPISFFSEKTIPFFINKDTGTVSFGGKNTNDEAKLHIFGSLIANNILNFASRLTICEDQSRKSVCDLNMDVYADFATTTANTLQYTGLETTLLPNYIYAIFCGQSAAGYINKVALRILNSAGTSWYNQFVYDINSGSTATRMQYYLPVFYYRGSSETLVRLYVSRTSTSTTKNRYKIFAVAGPFL